MHGKETNIRVTIRRALRAQFTYLSCIFFFRCFQSESTGETKMKKSGQQCYLLRKNEAKISVIHHEEVDHSWRRRFGSYLMTVGEAEPRHHCTDDFIRWDFRDLLHLVEERSVDSHLEGTSPEVTASDFHFQFFFFTYNLWKRKKWKSGWFDSKNCTTRR